MLNHYNWSETSEGYEFTTISQLNYLVYFTEFHLQATGDGEDILVYSLGITCREGDDFSIGKKDGLIQATVTAIILDFFKNNTEEAVLYVCLTDSNARGRRITFGRWFREFGGNVFEKHDCNPECAKNGLYASIIVRADCDKKDEYIDSFHHTIDSYYGPLTE